jgi:hypothetical protein
VSINWLTGKFLTTVRIPAMLHGRAAELDSVSRSPASDDSPRNGQQ